MESSREGGIRSRSDRRPSGRPLPPGRGIQRVHAPYKLESGLVSVRRSGLLGSRRRFRLFSTRYVFIMESSKQNDVVAFAFSRQAASFNASATANAVQLLDTIVEHAQPKSSERWFEGACGSGIISRRLAQLAESVHGVDLTRSMVETARREAAAAALENVTFEVDDATATPLPDASFDGAVTRFSVHHIPFPARLIIELTRLVRPGGKVVVLDHLADEDAESRSWVQEIERLRDPSHWACLSAAHLRRIGTDAGLELGSEQTFSFELARLRRLALARHR